LFTRHISYKKYMNWLPFASTWVQSCLFSYRPHCSSF